MNGIRGGVNGPRALDNLAGVIDKDQVGDANAAEINRQRIHPEMISQDRVAYRDVSANAVIEAVMRKDPVGGGEALLAMQALVQFGCKHRHVGPLQSIGSQSQTQLFFSLTHCNLLRPRTGHYRT